MNSTNRFLNRLLVFVIGLVLLLAGAVVAVGAVIPDVQRVISDGAQNATNPTADALSGGQPWLPWAIAAAALVLIVLLLWFVFRQGHGRTSTLLDVTSGTDKGSPTGGTVTIDSKVAEQILEESLGRNPSIVSVDVTAFEIKKQNTLRITAQIMRGVSPVEVRRSIDRAVADWDSLLGTTVPVVIQITGGLRSRLSGTSRVE